MWTYPNPAGPSTPTGLPGGALQTPLLVVKARDTGSLCWLNSLLSSQSHGQCLGS